MTNRKQLSSGILARCLKATLPLPYLLASLFALAAPALSAADLSLGTYATTAGPSAGSSSDIVVTSSSWGATSNAPWIHLISASGSSSGLATFGYDANAGATRVGTISFNGGEASLTVTQAGTAFYAQSQLTTLVSSGLNIPFGVAVDGAGNVYIADAYNNAIKEWQASTQSITMLVSTGLSLPAGVAVDGSGNVFIADTGNNAIKEWNAASQTVTTLVSSGLSSPYSVAVDGAGNVYIADTSNNAIKEWNAAAQTVTTLVSSGLNSPFGVAVDRAGNVYIADTLNNAIKEWNAATQQLSILVSSGLNHPFSVAVDGAGNVFISDGQNSALKEWNAATQSMTTLVASGLAYPNGVAVDGAGNLYIASASGDAIKKYTPGFIAPAGTAQLVGPAAGSSAVEFTTLPIAQALPWIALTTSSWIHLTASNGVSPTPAQFTYDANTGSTRTGTISLNGAATLIVTQAGSPYLAGSVVSTLVSSGLNYPSGVAVDGVGNVYIADYNSNAIKEWNAATQQVSTLVSSGLNFPFGIAVDGAGNVYIANSNSNAIKEWNAATQQVSTLVSSGLDHPSGVAVDGAGNVYIADYNNNAIKEWNAATQTVTTLVSSGLLNPEGLAVDGAGNVYITDTNNAIKEWNSATQQVSTLVSSDLGYPYGVAVDGAGNVFIADTSNNAIKEWNAATQSVTALVSTGLNKPIGVAVDGAGNVYIGDHNNNAIKKFTPGFIGPASLNESAAAGTDQLLPVLPSGTPLSGAASDENWLTIGTAANDVLSFSFTANTSTVARVAHISVLGQSIAVTQAGLVATTISINNIPANPLAGGSFTPTYAYAGNGTTSVTSSTPTTCTVSGGVVSFVGADNCSLTAAATGTSADASATGAVQTFAISLISPTITISNIPANPVYGGSFTPAYIYAGTGTTSVMSSTTTTCTVSGGVVNFVSVGVCTLVAGAGANGNYGPATSSPQSFSIGGATTTISINNIPSSAVFGGSFTPTYTYSGNGTTSVTSSSSATCTVLAGVVNFTGGGSCTLVAHASLTTNYAAATGSPQAFTIAPATTNISISNIPAAAIVTGSFTPAYTYIGNGTPSVSSTSSAICTVSGAVVSFVGPGTCILTASATFTTNYVGATGSPQSFTVSPNATTISNIQALNIAGTSEMIVWTTDQPSTSLVNYGLSSSYGSSSTTNSNLVTYHSVTIAGLSANTTYNFDLVSTNATSVTTTTGNAKFKTTPYVGYLAFWGVNNSGVTISWSTDTPASTTVAYGTSAALGQLSTIQAGLTTSHGVVLTGLNSGTTYYFQAQSTDANGNTGGSIITSFTTTGQSTSPAPVITNVLSGSIGMTSATITWTTDQLSTSQVNYGPNASYGSSSPLNSTPVASHTITLTNLAPGTTYNFDVVSANSTGTSVGTSANYTFATSASNTAPVISNVSSGTPAANSVTIIWTTDQPAWSLVNYGPTPGYGLASPLNNNLVTSHSVTIGGLAPNTTYNFDVVSENAAALSQTSGNYTFITAAVSTAPAPYVGYLAFWGVNNIGVTISWSTDLLADTEIAYGTSAAGLPSPVVESSALSNSHGVVLTTLNPGTTYYFQAVAKTAAGGIGRSQTYSFTTSGTATTPPAISNVAYSNVTGNSATITWSTDQPSSTQVNYGTSTSYAFSTTQDPTLVTSHSVNLTGLLSGTLYDFQAASGASLSGNFGFTTTGSVVQEPVISNVAATSVTGTTAVITWTTDQAANSTVNYGTGAGYGSTATGAASSTSHSVMLSGLAVSTIYNFQVLSGTTTSPNYTFTTSPGTGAPPVVSYVAFWGATGSGVNISWSTNVPATTQVNFGTTASLGTLTPLQSALTNSHGVMLTSLQPGTTYYFVAQSTDANGDTGYSATTYSFSTTGGAPTISGVIASPSASNRASISWVTSVPTYSYVQYGTASGNYNRYSAQTSLTAAPNCTLAYVPSGKIYYQLVSTDGNGNQTVSAEMTFTEP